MNPGPADKIVCTIVHAIANTIAHKIIKINVRTKYAQMHERVPHGTCPLDGGQWPDLPKMDNGQTVLKMTNYS